MKKKGIIIIPVLIVLCLMYPIGRLFIADTPAQAETGKISPKIKLYAFFSGGYSRLYDKLIEKGMDGKDALNYISRARKHSLRGSGRQENPARSAGCGVYGKL